MMNSTSLLAECGSLDSDRMWWRNHGTEENREQNTERFSDLVSAFPYMLLIDCYKTCSDNSCSCSSPLEVKFSPQTALMTYLLFGAQ